MDRETLHVYGHRSLPVDRFAEHIEKASERRFADRHRDRCAGGTNLFAAREPCRLVHRNGTHTVETEVRGDLEGDASMRVVLLDDERIADRRTSLFPCGEMYIDDRSDDLCDYPVFHIGKLCLLMPHAR